jgi:GDP/UDP-N,N'-diacetylbacillosamine 2-epimerase (hydrolysing)
MKKIAVLTCGRSDFSIYLPLLQYMERRKNVEMDVIAFGSHTSHYHGYSLAQVNEAGLSNVIPIDTTLSDDGPDSIAMSMGLTIIRLADIWRNNKFDLVFCLGDRYEMFAAVSSAINFNLKIVHFHGGEKTLGAIDNSFRHAITSMSNYHFTSCEEHKLRVQEIVENEKSDFVFNVGAMSLQNLKAIDFIEKEKFSEKFNININKPTALVTYHPETIALDVNQRNIDELLATFDVLDEQILLTLPNNDSMAAYAREAFLSYASSNKKCFVYDFLGVSGYYSAMKYCTYMLGNTSSGIIEAASLGCYVINVGDRQQGRQCNDNVFHTSCRKDSILKLVKKIRTLGSYNGSNIYFQKNTLKQIINILKLDK